MMHDLDRTRTVSLGPASTGPRPLGLLGRGLLAVALAAFLAGCGESGGGAASSGGTAAHDHDDHDDDHDHADDDHDHDHDHDHEMDDHSDAVELGAVTIDGVEVRASQAHGELAAGKELFLMLVLSDNEGGATAVRAWIGTENRLASEVAKAEFHADHGDYELHAMAPDPLPENAKWWIELERADGTKAVGSIDAH